MSKFLAFFFLVYLGFASSNLCAQSSTKSSETGLFTKIIGGFSLHASTGFGLTFYSNEIKGPGILQQKDGNVFLFNNFFVIGGDSLSQGYNGWVNNAKEFSSIAIGDDDYLLGTDTLAIKYKGTGGSIPISVAISYTFDRYRFGGGFTYEQAFAAKYYPNARSNSLEPFNPDYITTSITRFYGYVGGEVFRSIRHTIAVDAMVGTFKYGKKKFNPDQIKYKLFVNIGVSFERSLSEYFKIFVRPSLEIKSYELTVPGLNYAVNHSTPAMYFNVGAILRMPDLNKCHVSQCKTQINHRHGNRVYRSKMHPFWKWQNPNYGQNFPQLIKYKGKNKKKKNPY